MNSKLMPDERRAIVIAALEHAANVTELAYRFGVSRTRIYQLMESATIDPKGKLKEAEREVAFRRRVKELVGRGNLVHTDSPPWRDHLYRPVGDTIGLFRLRLSSAPFELFLSPNRRVLFPFERPRRIIQQYPVGVNTSLQAFVLFDAIAHCVLSSVIPQRR
jgi:hypothetical protein